MRRREFVSMLGGSVLAPIVRPRFAWAQPQAAPPTIGFLGATTKTIWSTFVAAFEQGLNEHGWITDQTIKIDYQWAGGNDGRYKAIADEFVRQRVAVIVTGGTQAVLAAKEATSKTKIPVVFATAGDPVGTRLVETISQPGDNITGFSNQQTDLAGKRVQLLQELVPGIRRLALLGNTDSLNVALEMKAVQETAAQRSPALEISILDIKRTDDVLPKVKNLKDRADGIYVCTDPLVTTNRCLIAKLALEESLPTINAFRQYVEAGGLMSYGPNFPDLFRRAAGYVDRILHGANPATLPVQQPEKFDTVMNWTTATKLNLSIPDSFRSRVPDIIEFPTCSDR